MSSVFNVPNQITSLRIVLAIGVFVLMSFEMYVPALIAFIVAASTDWVDGFYARRYNQVTKLGRILDPFADKLIICGVFIYLSALYPRSGIHAWVTVVVVSRELLVTALRSAIEQSGGDFSASMPGKLKMVFQCGAAIASLVALSLPADETTPAWLAWTVFAFVWLTVISTVYSGVDYIFAAVRQLRD